MTKNTDLIQINTTENNILNEFYDLHISDKFLKSFDLTVFLANYVLANSFHPTGKEKEKIIIENYDQLLEIIIKKWKAKKYIGVGVGGVYIRDGINKHRSEDEYVLLYKRYHEPEDQQWSILGGSSVFAKKIEDTLKDKISAITKIDRDAISVKDIIKANNHRQRSGEDEFHYLSPSYYVEITNPASKLSWGNKKVAPGKKIVAIVDSLDDFDEIDQSKKDNVCLAWVKVDLVTSEAIDSDGKPIFAFTTVEALNSHRIIRNTTKQMTAQLEAATMQMHLTEKTINSYRDWRTSNGH